MSLEVSVTGASQLYSSQAASSGDAPEFGCPQFPQPSPAPGFELSGSLSWLTLLSSSHDAAPEERIAADEPNSAVASDSDRATSTSRSLRSSPSSAQNRST